MQTVAITIGFGFLAWGAMVTLHRLIVLRCLTRLSCAHCDVRFSLTSARSAKNCVQHISWAPGARPRLGESASDIYRIVCAECECDSVFNLRGSRYDMFETASNDPRA